MKEVSRRNFIKSAGLLGAATLAGGALAGCSAGQGKAITSEEAASGVAGSPENTGAVGETNALACDYPLDINNILPIDPDPVPDSWGEECDVVVVGSGAGGLIAAAKLAAEGKNVIVCEAGNHVGGTSLEATYCATKGGVERLWGDWGAYGTPYSDQDVVDAWQELAKNSLDSGLLMNMTVASHESVDFLLDEGLDMVDIMTDAGMEGVNSGSVILRGSLYDEGDITTWGYIPSVTSQMPTMKAIHALGESHGAKYYVSCPVKGLVFDGERVCGVKAEKDGSEMFIKANDAVTIHAGDFGYNRDLMMIYCPMLGYGAANSMMAMNNDGWLHRACMGLGADMTDLDTFSVRDGTCSLGTKELEYHDHWYADDLLARQPWLTIDCTGRQLPYHNYAAGPNEKSDSKSVSLAELSGCTTALTVPGRRVIPIWDSKYSETVPITGRAGGPQSNGGRLFRDDKLAPYPWMNDPERTAAAMVDHDFEKGIQNSIARGFIQQADTIEELAEKIGVDAAGLKETIDLWNEKCTAGEGFPEYGYWAEEIYPLDTPPYYFARTGASVQGIGTGIRVDKNLNVMRVDGTTIPGLYAGFHFAGGASGSGRGCGEPIFSQVGTSLYSGYLAAKSILTLKA